MNINTTIDFENSKFAKLLNEITKSKLYEKKTPELGYQHKISHVQKVMIFSQLIAQNENLNYNDTKILLISAAFHDIGRTKDRGDNGTHGAESAKIVKNYLLNNINNPYNIKQDEIGIVQVAINYHVISDLKKGEVDDSILQQLCNQYQTDKKDYERIKVISSILKDADALDRFRFSSINLLDSSFLRTKSAKNELIINLAKKLNQEYAKVLLNSNYAYNYIIDNNYLITLNKARKDFVSKYGYTKKERTIPSRTLKLIYNDSLINDKKNDQTSFKYTNMGRLSIGGTGEMFLCKDENGNDYIFKPSYKKNTNIYEQYRADIQIAAAKLQRLITPETAVKCEYCKIDGINGTIQPYIEINEQKTRKIYDYYLKGDKLDEKIAKQFMGEYVLDYCFCNYDSTFRNFIVDKDGNLRGVDKEQCFKYINEDDDNNYDLLMECNPNLKYGANPPIYGKIIRDIMDGKLSILILETLKKKLENAKNISAEKYNEIITPYINSLNKNIDKQSLYAKIIKRKESLAQIYQMVYYIEKIAKKRNNNAKEI